MCFSSPGQVYRDLKEVTPEAMQVVKRNFEWVAEKVEVRTPAEDEPAGGRRGDLNQQHNSVLRIPLLFSIEVLIISHNVA